jgi:hypothetical protein
MEILELIWDVIAFAILAFCTVVIIYVSIDMITGSHKKRIEKRYWKTHYYYCPKHGEVKRNRYLIANDNESYFCPKCFRDFIEKYCEKLILKDREE